jgi:DNA-binding MarR family transcriptional regulator
MKKSSSIPNRKPPEKGDEPPAETIVELADRLHSAAIHLLRRVRKEDEVTGEGPARLSALSVLVFAGEKTLGELAAIEQVRPPTMSRIVSGLKASGLIAIRQDARDARRMCIRATSKGITLLRAAREKRIASLAAQLLKLSARDLAKLQDAAEVLRHVLDVWP